ncbi:MAG: hypothetical protein ACRD3D_13240 [Terriglobia bacterium]
MATKTIAPSVRTLDHLLDEAEEYSKEFLRLRAKMSRLKSGSEPYLDLMADMAIAALSVKLKMESVQEEADAIILAMPDDD